MIKEPAIKQQSDRGAAVTTSPWGPLGVTIFRWLWIASVASNLGTWMQSVGATWLMTLLTPSPVLVALMQTATSLPVFLVGLPAGAIADVVDRRKLLLVSQGWMLVVAVLLGLLATLNLLSAGILLLLTFLLGLGSALNAPAWQAIVPELVGKRMVAQAIALNSAGYNLARAIGPALGGIVVAASGPGAVFFLNAASFLGVLVVIWRWPRPHVESLTPPENVLGAIAAGTRYAGHSRSLQAVLVRVAVFIVAASALWALLPVVASHDLLLDAGGYGVLLGSLGVGAILGAVFIHRLNAILSTDQLTVLASLAFGFATLALGYIHVIALLLPMLALGGVAWMVMMSSLNVAAQGAAPDWVRARALGIYLLVFQGGMALSSFTWGALAGWLGNGTALLLAALGLGMSVLAALRWPLHSIQNLDLSPAIYQPQPDLAVTPRAADGPVMVTVEYRVLPDQYQEFVTSMQRVGRVRRRTGAFQWGLFQDPADPERFTETYFTRTWAEYTRQQTRATVTDQAIQEAAIALTAPGTTPRVSPLIAAEPPRH
jgi:MFS family permease